eukprot:1468939-Pyramimonas_sp.AAC.1
MSRRMALPDFSAIVQKICASFWPKAVSRVGSLGNSTFSSNRSLTSSVTAMRERSSTLICQPSAHFSAKKSRLTTLQAKAFPIR